MGWLVVGGQSVYKGPEFINALEYSNTNTSLISRREFLVFPHSKGNGEIKFGEIIKEVCISIVKSFSESVYLDFLKGADRSKLKGYYITNISNLFT